MNPLNQTLQQTIDDITEFIHNYYRTMNHYTFEQVKEIAAKNGITGSNIRIGLWA